MASHPLPGRSVKEQRSKGRTARNEVRVVQNFDRKGAGMGGTASIMALIHGITPVVET